MHQTAQWTVLLLWEKAQTNVPAYSLNCCTERRLSERREYRITAELGNHSLHDFRRNRSGTNELVKNAWWFQFSILLHTYSSCNLLRWSGCWEVFVCFNTESLCQRDYSDKYIRGHQQSPFSMTRNEFHDFLFHGYYTMTCFISNIPILVRRQLFFCIM